MTENENALMYGFPPFPSMYRRMYEIINNDQERRAMGLSWWEFLYHNLYHIHPEYYWGPERGYV